MLIYHPQSDKNRGLKQKFEHFAEATEAGLTGLNDLQFFRYNGINESEVFKTPSKLPALVYFKRIETPDGEVDYVKECTEFKDVRSHMLFDSTDDAF